jgi:membrane-bound serine protease (ClpP class)
VKKVETMVRPSFLYVLSFAGLGICIASSLGYQLQYVPLGTPFGLLGMLPATFWVGIAFMVAEAFVPAYGSLGIGGVVAFVVVLLMLIDTDIPGFGISRTLIGVLALVTVAFVFVVVRMALRARRRPVVSGVESLVGADGEMIDDATDTGWANIRGETWQVKTAARVARGQKVRVVAVDGVLPRVAPSGDA